MTLVAVNSTPTTCPDCEGPLSLPLASKARPGMVIQKCKNFQTCGRMVWSEVGTVIVERLIDDGSRHSRMFEETAPPRLYAPNRWKRITDSELATVNQCDRKRAAAGDR